VGLFFSPENMKNGVCTMGIKKFWKSRLILLCHDCIDLIKGDLFWNLIMPKSSFYDTKCFYFVQIDSNWLKFSTPVPTAQSFLTRCP
jgi:hypothetical protein